MQINVEVEPLVGTRDTPLGRETIEHATQMIFASTEELRESGKPRIHIGYVDKGEGKPVNWLPAAKQFSEGTRSTIASQVSELMAGDVKRKENGPPVDLPTVDDEESDD